jgi:hypothetical protein
VGSSEPQALLIRIFIRVSPIFLQHQYAPASRAAGADLSASHRPSQDIMLSDRKRPWRRPVCRRGHSSRNVLDFCHAS